MHIGPINLDEKVLIVAEIGNNHEGSMETARQMVQQAADCGVDAVKFQTFRVEHFVRPDNQTRYQQLAGYQLSTEQFMELHDLAVDSGLLFISTPLDLPSAYFLADLVAAFKIASGDNNFFPLLDVVCQSGKPVIISSGLSDLAHMKACVSYVRQRQADKGQAEDVAVLHCISAYPTPGQEVNLAAIQLLHDELGVTAGYSDHTLGIEAASLAVTAGARIIEKHFTLDKNYSSFRDHQLSADPDEMRRLVKRVREIEVLYGQPEKQIQPGETAGLPLIRRSIVAGMDLPAGHSLRFEDLAWMRPADGLSPGEESQIIGRRLKKPLKIGQTILPDNLEL